MKLQVSHTEENYLKAIFGLTINQSQPASTNAIAQKMQTSAASVTDMIKRLSEKELVAYQRYKGVTLTDLGRRHATHLIRKHRLWECFLVDQLNFSWDEVHEIAEQLEHIQSPELVERLDAFLGHPKYDPHGDPIPNAEGEFSYRQQVPLSQLSPDYIGILVGVQDHDPVFLQYLDKQKLPLGTHFKVLEVFPYDESVKVLKNDTEELILSKKVCQNLFVETQ